MSLTDILSLPKPDLDLLVQARLDDLKKRTAGMEQARQLEKMAKKL